MDHDTRDTAETLLDSAADAKTIKQHAADPDSPTHRLDPRAYAPLRVCPQCSLAWESLADWCPSCGTAFDIRDRETQARPSATRVRPGRTGERPAARNSRARRSAPNSTRSSGERAAAHAATRRSNRTDRTTAPRQRRSGGWAFAIVLLAIIPLAFLLGQQTRQSRAEVDSQIKAAVDQNTRSAVNSAQRELQRQKNRLQKQFNARVAAAEAKAYEDGKANAEAQVPEGSLTEELKRCIANFLVDC